jgi:hypothetical protein
MTCISLVWYNIIFNIIITSIIIIVILVNIHVIAHVSVLIALTGPFSFVYIASFLVLLVMSCHIAIAIVVIPTL